MWGWGADDGVRVLIPRSTDGPVASPKVGTVPEDGHQ